MPNKTPRQIAQEYLENLRAIHTSGAAVAETSYYPALCNLFDAVGDSLKPKVRCIIHTQNQGAGIPDGGLFTAEQFQRQTSDPLQAGQPPSRGVVEAKGTKPDIKSIAFSSQSKNI